MGLIKQLLGWIGGILGAIFGIFRRRPQVESAGTAFFLDPEEARTVGRQNELANERPNEQPKERQANERPSERLKESPLPAPKPTPTLVFSSGSPDLRNRRRPGANMSSFLDLAKQIRQV